MPSQVVHLSGLAYWHQGSVVLPRRLRPPASALLGDDLAEPPFDEPDDDKLAVLHDSID